MNALIFTEETFERGVRYSSQSAETLRLVKSVLVTGVSASCAARQYDITRQAVHSACRTFISTSMKPRLRNSSAAVKAAVAKMPGRTLNQRIAILAFDRNYSTRFIASVVKLPEPVVTGRIQHIRRRLESNKPLRSDLVEHQRIEFTTASFEQALEHPCAAGLCPATLMIARRYHLDGKSRPEIALEIGAQAHNVFSSLSTFARRYAAYLAEQRAGEARDLPTTPNDHPSA